MVRHVQGQLRSANVGDSGYMVLTEVPGGGRYELRYHTPQQEHSFGCPYQLGHYEGADAPEDAMLMTLPVSLCCLCLCQAMQLTRAHALGSMPSEPTQQHQRACEAKADARRRTMKILLTHHALHCGHCECSSWIHFCPNLLALNAARFVLCRTVRQQPIQA